MFTIVHNSHIKTGVIKMVLWLVILGVVCSGTIIGLSVVNFLNRIF